MRIFWLWGTFVILFLVKCEGQFPSQTGRVATGDHVTEILNNIRQSYDKRVRPNYGGEPVDVGITMYVLSVSSVSEVNMDFTMDFYFRQSWNDPRLSFKGQPGLRSITVGTEFLKTIWIPDTFFVNEKMSYFHTATAPNEFLRISESGDIMRSIRLTVTASCPMNLRNFPMDTQRCRLEMESFGSNMSDIRYSWAKGVDSVGVAGDVSLPQFKIVGHRQLVNEASLGSGNYSRLECELVFERSLGYYLLQIYCPATLIVLISFVTFWINRNATTARVALGITTILTMTTLMSSVNASLPKISYIRSLDVFLGTCFVITFAALLEFATVGYVGKQIEMRKEEDDAEGGNANGTNAKKVGKWGGVAPADLDRYSRILFPAIFACFQFLYWVICLNISDD
ncbi:gamma-aminobutyric acid receptor subunit beta [Folsomia candida]|uniref:gamma-aminobutyric acid receptor subunit beta n=1 Tax=Folsomia candida TaxID=158441 RepID=UPI000B8EFAB9|nr:gamma-aminobutyric acid receptor subunit beta [Folsomia candida]